MIDFLCVFRMPQSQRSVGMNPALSAGKQKARQGKSVRLNINARERRRMHDLVNFFIFKKGSM